MTRQTDISDYGHAVRIARFGGCKTSLDAITKCRASRDRKPFDHDTGPRPAGYTTIRNLDCLRNQECLSTCIRIFTKLCLSALFFRRMTSRIQLSDACVPHRSYKGTMCRQSAASHPTFSPGLPFSASSISPPCSNLDSRLTLSARARRRAERAVE